MMMFRNHAQKGSAKVRTLDIAVPARYTLRTNRADTAGYGVSGICFLGLWAALLFRRPDPEALAAGALLLIPAAAVLLLLIRGLRFSLAVDGKRITLRRWLRPPLEFTFSDLHYIQPRRGGYILWSREGRRLCQLPFNLRHLDILQADLRSRGAAFQRDAPPVPTVLAPGPRRVAEAVELPAHIPACYCVGIGGTERGIFLFGTLFFAVCIAGCFWIKGLSPELFLLLPFLLLCLVPLALSGTQSLEVEDGVLRRWGFWGKTTDFRFSDISVVHVENAATGFGPVTLVRLLDRKEQLLAAPSPSLRNIQILLADLIDRGLSFTY